MASGFTRGQKVQARDSLGVICNAVYVEEMPNGHLVHFSGFGQQVSTMVRPKIESLPQQERRSTLLTRSRRGM